MQRRFRCLTGLHCPTAQRPNPDRTGSHCFCSVLVVARSIRTPARCRRENYFCYPRPSLTAQFHVQATTTMMLLIFGLVSLVAFRVEAQIQLYQYGVNASTMISDACSSTLARTLDCDPYLYTLATIDFFGPLGNDSFQDALCESACGASLGAYHTAVEDQCANDPDPWNGVPAVWAGDILWSTYNRTCLKDPDTGRYCTGKRSAAVGCAGLTRCRCNRGYQRCHWRYRFRVDRPLHRAALLPVHSDLDSADAEDRLLKLQ